MQNPSYGKPLQDYLCFEDYLREDVINYLFKETNTLDIFDFLYDFERMHHDEEIIEKNVNAPLTIRDYLNRQLKIDENSETKVYRKNCVCSSMEDKFSCVVNCVNVMLFSILSEIALKYSFKSITANLKRMEWLDYIIEIDCGAGKNAEYINRIKIIRKKNEN